MGKINQHIIFDLDGTIIDSQNEIRKTYEVVIDKVTPPIKINPSKLNYGSTLNEVLKEIYLNEPDKMAKAKLLFASIYDNSDYAETNLYPGVIETLDHLYSNKHRLYIATNKRSTPTLRILQKKNISHYFVEIMANEMKPNITVTKRQMIAELKGKHSFSDGYMIGDSILDIEAGNNQNLKTIAVTYGFEKRDTFASQNPTYIIDSFKEIINLI